MATQNEVQVEETYGVKIYSLETPSGYRWSWDEDDLNEAYIEDVLWAWSRLLDFVKARNGD